MARDAPVADEGQMPNTHQGIHHSCSNAILLHTTNFKRYPDINGHTPSTSAIVITYVNTY